MTLLSLWTRTRSLQKRLLKALEKASPRWSAFIGLLENQLIAEGYDDESLAEEISKILEHWGAEGARIALDFIEDTQLYLVAFREMLRSFGRDTPSFVAELRKRADGGSYYSSLILGGVERDLFERNLEGLAASLRDEVFPSDWVQWGTDPHLSKTRILQN